MDIWKETYLKEDTLFISGLIQMASSCSRIMGCSYATGLCFRRKNYLKGFQDFYEIKEEIKLKKLNISLEKLITRIFDKNKRMITGLAHWIHYSCGDTLNIYRINDEVTDLLSGYNKGHGPFFFCEDIYFIECEKKVVCLMIGNDE